MLQINFANIASLDEEFKQPPSLRNVWFRGCGSAGPGCTRTLLNTAIAGT